MIRGGRTPREALQYRGYCTGPVDGAPAPRAVGPDNRAPCCTCQRRVHVTSRGRYAHHRATVESQRAAAEKLLPALTEIQIRALRRHVRGGSWYRLHVHGHTTHSLERRGLITRSGSHVTPLGHAVLEADRARIPNIFLEEETT